MYRWIWERLPGPTVARLVVAALLVVAAVAFLVLVAFPWLELLLPFTEVNVGIVGPPARITLFGVLS